MNPDRPPEYIVDRCRARAVRHARCYTYCCEIDGDWYVYVRLTLAHAQKLIDAGHRVWVMFQPIEVPNG